MKRVLLPLETFLDFEFDPVWPEIQRAKLFLSWKHNGDVTV